MHPERMYQIQLLCRTEDAAHLIDALAALKAVHITDHKKTLVGNEQVDIGTSLPHAEEISSALTAARSLLSRLPVMQGKDSQSPELLARIRRVHEIADSWSKHEQIRDGIEQEQLRLRTTLALLALLPKQTILESLNAKSVETLLLRESEQSNHALLAQLNPLLLIPYAEQRTVLVSFLTSDAPVAKLALEREGFSIVDLRALRHLEGSRDQAHAQIMQQLAELDQAQNNNAAQLKHLLHERPFIERSERVLSYALLKAQAPLRFGVTKSLTLVSGYVPESSISKLETLPQPVVIDTVLADEAPTKLKNRDGVRNFEELIKLYTLPRYNEIDPTSLLAFTFPLFFGFMLGDIGYGVCALVLFLLLGRFVPKVKPIATILTISAIASIAFGFLFGEAFGAEQLFGIALHPFIHRTQDIMMMFMIAAAIGVVHLNLGLLIGMINESRDGIFFAIVRKGSWMLLQIGALLLAASFGVFEQSALAWLPENLIVAAACLLVALAGIGISEGAKGLIELPMIFSNILSYTRLVAIGLASVYMAFVVNQIAGDLWLKGGAWIILGVLILVLGHALNLLLGLFGPFLHSLRLHYVEFFTKFYEGGGKPYRPFGVLDDVA